MSKVIMITGCSTGIGLCTAKMLNERGHQVFATARNNEDLNALKALGLNAIACEMRDSESIQAAFNAVIDAAGRLDVLINNAGFGQMGALEDISRDVLRQQFETNVFGLHELSTYAIRHMRQHQQGRIINLSSVLGLVSMPFRGAYNASKYAVEGLSDTLRLELSQENIQVITIEPGPITSQFRNTAAKSEEQLSLEKSVHATRYQRLKKTISDKPPVFNLPPEAVAKKIIHAVESARPKPRYYVTTATYLLGFAKRVLPTRWLDKLLIGLTKSETS